MQRGSILESARRDTKGWLLAGAILAGLCLGVLGLNWKFLYNAAAGPVPFTAALSQSPGARVTAAKGSKPASYSLQLYVAGQALCDLIDMSQNDTRRVRARRQDASLAATERVVTGGPGGPPLLRLLRSIWHHDDLRAHVEVAHPLRD